MAKLSIEITGRNRSGLFLLSALSQQGPTVAKLLTDKIRLGLQEGEEPPDPMPQIALLNQMLQSALGHMVKVDADLYRENASRADLLRERESNVAVLGRKVTGIRRIVTGHYMAPDVAQLGLVGPTAREVVALLRQTELICEQLKSEALAEMLGTALFEPAHDPSPYVDQIELDIKVLRLAHQTHHQSKRRVDELLARKKKAVADYDTVFIRIARQFEDMCRLVGEDDLADKVRPSLTRKGETLIPPVDDGDQNGREGDPQDADPADDATSTEGEAPSGSSADPDTGSTSDPAAESSPSSESEPMTDSDSA